MKFGKAIIINIDQADLDDEIWKKLDQLVSEKVLLPKNDSRIIKEVESADCILTGFGVELTSEVIDEATKLKYIGLLSTAYGKINTDYAAKRGIPVSNLAGYSTESVAEFTIAAILELTRGLEEGKKRGRHKNYSEVGINAWELKDSSFGILGLGNIGQRVAELAAGFDARVSYWSRSKKNVPYNFKDIDDLIIESDFISINLSQTEETEKIFDKKRIKSLKPNCVVINTCPMELVDINALDERLSKNDIYFILDHSDEMSEENLAILSKHESCIVYPPIAYITEQARQNKQKLFINNIEAALSGKPQNQVN